MITAQSRVASAFRLNGDDIGTDDWLRASQIGKEVISLRRVDTTGKKIVDAAMSAGAKKAKKDSEDQLLFASKSMSQLSELIDEVSFFSFSVLILV